MKNTKTSMSSTMSKLGALVVMGVTLMLGGCASAPPVNISEIDRSGRGEMYAIVDLAGTRDAVSMCAEHARAKIDPRCSNAAAYYGKNVTPHTEGLKVTLIPVMVPNEVKVNGNDIIKIRMQDGVPAFYEGTFGKVTAGFQNTTQDCYLDKNIFGSGGVVCPKFNWSYKNLK